MQTAETINKIKRIALHTMFQVVVTVATLIAIFAITKVGGFIHAASLLQSQTGTAINAATVEAGYGQATVAGNLLIASAGSLSNMSINAPAGWSTAINESGEPGLAIFYKIADGNETTVTVTTSGVSASLGLQIYEYAGYNTDLSQTDSSFGYGSIVYSGQVTTAQNNQLIFAVFAADISNTIDNDSWTDDGFVEENDFKTSPNGSKALYAGGDSISNSPGAQNATVLTNDANWRGQIVSFSSSTPELSSSTKSDSDADNNVNPGQTVTYTITIVNSGGGDATGIVLNDTMDSNTENLGNFTFTDCGSSVINNSSGSGVNVVGLESAVGTDCVVTYTVDIKFLLSEGATINNNAIINPAFEGGPGASPSSDTLTVDITPDLSTSGKTENDDDNEVDEGQTITYTITVINTGDGTATGVDIDDNISGKLEHLTVQSITDCGTPSDTSNPTRLKVYGATIEVGVDCVIIFSAVVRNNVTGLIDNTASISAAQEGGSGASPSTDTLILASDDIGSVKKSIKPLNINIVHDLCTESGNIRITMKATNVAQYIIAENKSFSDASWQPFVSPERIEWPMIQDGNLKLYVKFMTQYGTESAVKTITINEANSKCNKTGEEQKKFTDSELAEEEEIEEEEEEIEEEEEEIEEPEITCAVECEEITYDLYIINPDGTERRMDSAYARIYELGNNRRTIKFEDNGSDFDYDAVSIGVDKNDCSNIIVEVLSEVDGWNHQIGIRLYRNNNLISDTILWEDSHLAYGNPISLDATALRNACDEVNVDVGPIDCKDVLYDVYIVNPDGSEHHMNSNYSFTQKIAEDVALIRFEDIGKDYDYNDVRVVVNKQQCDNITFRVDAVNAEVSHQIKAGIYHDKCDVINDILLWEDSQQAAGQSISIDAIHDLELCSQYIKKECSTDCSVVDYNLYIVNPDKSRRYIDTGFAKAVPLGSDLVQYQFEDSGFQFNFDHDDIWITANSQDCANMYFTLDALGSNWSHQVWAEILYEGEVIEERRIWKNSQTAVGETKVVDIKGDNKVCAADNNKSNDKNDQGLLSKIKDAGKKVFDVFK